MKKADKIRYFPKPKPFQYMKRNQKFYDSTAWRRCRNYYISLHPLCEQCEREGRITVGQVIDHIKPLDQTDPYKDDPFNENNLQTLCHKCHNKKTGKGQ